MNRYTTVLRPLALAAFLVASGASQAGITVYTTQSSFLAAISNFATDTFDDLPPGRTNLDTAAINRSAGAYAYTASVGEDSLATGGTGSDVWLTTDPSNAVLTFDNFSSGVYAVGGFFFGSNSDGGAQRRGSITVTATDADGTITTETKRNPRTSNFFGFVSDSSLTSVTVSTTTRRGSMFPTVNNLTLAAAVPEPETYALLLSGLAIVGFVARRRRDR
jgi:hypothetical protein